MRGNIFMGKATAGSVGSEQLELIYSDPYSPHPWPSKSDGASQSQVGGNHYKKCAIQPWDYTIANKLDYFQGSIIKYVTRWRDKGGVGDLEKALHFLKKYIETERKNESA